MLAGMSTAPRSSLGRVLDDLGLTLLEVAHGTTDAARDIGGVVIHDPVDDPLFPQHAIVLGVGVADSEQLAALLRELAGRDVAAVVVRSPVDVTEEVREAAGDVVVLGLARGATWTQLAALLRSLLAEDDFGEISVETLGGLPSGDLFAVANAIAALLDAPVTIEDRSTRVLAFSGRQDEADPSRAETILGRQVPERYARVLTELGVFRDLYRDDRPVVVDPVTLGEGVTTQRVAIGVRAGDEVLGSIWAAMDGPLTAERTATLRDAAKLVALHLLRVRAGADVQRRLRAELVSTALEGGAGAREALARLGLAGQSVGVLAAAPTAAPDGSQRADQQLLADRERFTDALAAHLSAVQPGAAVALVGDTAFAILPAAGPDAEVRLVGVAENFLERVGARMPGVIAVGPPAEDIAGIAQSRAVALRVLRVLRDGPGSRAARMTEVQTASLLLELRDLVLARGDAPDGALARLIDYDRRNDGHLVDTLRAWLDHFGDVGAAAAATYVHHNTFRYRLRRVREVGGLDLSDAETRFAAMLQLRMLGG